LSIGAAPHRCSAASGRAGPYPCRTGKPPGRAVLLDGPLGALRRSRTVVAFPTRQDALLPTEGRECTARAAGSEAGGLTGRSAADQEACGGVRRPAGSGGAPVEAVPAPLELLADYLPVWLLPACVGRCDCAKQSLGKEEGM